MPYEWGLTIAYGLGNKMKKQEEYISEGGICASRLCSCTCTWGCEIFVLNLVFFSPKITHPNSNFKQVQEESRNNVEDKMDLSMLACWVGASGVLKLFPLGFKSFKWYIPVCVCVCSCEMQMGPDASPGWLCWNRLPPNCGLLGQGMLCKVWDAFTTLYISCLIVASCSCSVEAFWPKKKIRWSEASLKRAMVAVKIDWWIRL